MAFLFGWGTFEASRAVNNNANFVKIKDGAYVANGEPFALFRIRRVRSDADSGSHSPLGDRQARLSGGECANLHAKRKYPSAKYKQATQSGGFDFEYGTALR